MRILERLPRETGRDYALRVLKDNIIHLDLAPGSQISENELAAELGLSRTPVREALIELSKVGIVEICPQKKSTVALIDYGMVDEARFMRGLLECAVAELVCAMATEADVARLKENIRLQKFYLESYYPDSLMELDREFHAMLFEIARKPEVYQLMQGISIHFDRVRSMVLDTVKNHRIVDDHEAIVDAVERGDAAAARAVMETHLNRYELDGDAVRARCAQYLADGTAEKNDRGQK